MTDEEFIFTEWSIALYECWLLAKGDRLGELRGKRPKLMDGRGLHPYSLAVQRVWSFEAMMPELRYAEFDPVVFRIEAYKEAERAFRMEILEEGLGGQGHRNKRRTGSANDGREGAEPLRDLAF